MGSWEDSGDWYGKIVGEKGHYYHQAVLIPNLLRLLSLKPKMSLLDMGCGQGVLFRSLPKEIDYWGLDLSESLIQEAKKRCKGAHFFVADASKQPPFDKSDFDTACFLLSLQNMQDPQSAIKIAAGRLRAGGKLLLILNHPCFRIPRQSSWEIDPKNKLQYRRVQSYMSSLKVPIQTHPSQGKKSVETCSYHFPLSSYTKFLKDAGLYIEEIEEWISDKKSEGSHAKMEDRARKEIPLFLALLAEKKLPKNLCQS